MGWRGLGVSLGCALCGLLLVSCAEEIAVTEPLVVETIRTDTTPGQNDRGEEFSAIGDEASCSAIYEAVGRCSESFVECQRACVTDSCESDCQTTFEGCAASEVNQGSADGQRGFEAVYECERSAYASCYEQGGDRYDACSQSCGDDACRETCSETATQLLRSCMSTQCESAYLACGLPLVAAPSDSNGPTNPGNPAQPPQTGGSDQSCEALYVCEDACRGDRNCGQTCYDQASESARQQWTRLIECGQQLCDVESVVDSASYRACLESRCNDRYQECFGTTGQPPVSGGGTQACGDGYSCIRTCYDSASDEASFRSCVGTCTQSMTSQALALLDTLKACIDQQCMNVPGSVDNYYQCHRDFCPNEYNACLADR